MYSKRIFLLLAALLLAVLVAVLLPGLVRAEGPAGVVVISQPAFTAPGAVVPIELMITGTTRVGNIYAQYDLAPVGSSSGFRTPDMRGSVGLNLVQWPAPTPSGLGDVLWYRVLAVADGATLAAPAEPLQNCIPFGRWLNAGSGELLTDRDAAIWEADRPWYHNAFGHDGVTRVITTSAHVQRAATYGEDPLYQRQRTSVGGRPFHYRFYYGGGFYQATLLIELRFAEIEKTAPGERVFDVLVDGQPLVSGLDLYAVAGPCTAHVVSRQLTITYRPDGDQTLDIAFVPRVGDAAVAGVSVRSLSAIPQYSTWASVAQVVDDTHVILQDGNYNREPYVRLGRYNDGFEYAAGLLFRGVQVPRGAFISSARLEAWSYPAAGWQYGQTDVTIYAQATDSAADFSWNQPKATVRPLLSPGVRWLIDRTWPAGQAFSSIDLAAAIQGVFDRPNWRPGNNLALLVMPNGGPIGWRDIAARDWSGGKPATLRITYVPPLYRDNK